MDALRAHFRPEFLNRVDEIIVFHALTREQMRSIIDIQLRGLMQRLEDRKIHIELTDRAKDLVIEEGYDPAYGARPLKRTIQRRSWTRWHCGCSRGSSRKATGFGSTPAQESSISSGPKAPCTPETCRPSIAGVEDPSKGSNQDIILKDD